MEATSTTSSAASSIDGRSGSGGASDFAHRGVFSSSGQLQPESLLAGGFSLGNGFGNDTTGLAGSALSSSGASLDLSEFPSLGGGNAVGTPPSVSSANPGNGLAAALREQQQLIAHQQMLQGGAAITGPKGSNLYMLAMKGSNGNFNMASEDFPALGGTPVQPTGGANGSSLNMSSLLSNNSSVQQSVPNENGLYGGSGLGGGTSHLEGGAGLLGGAGLGGLGGLRNSGTSLPSVPSVSAPAGTIGSSASGGVGTTAGNALGSDYGLLGLLGVIRMTDADRNILALGSDLQLLGMNLGPSEEIYSTFASPWAESGNSKEPHYQLPMCYYIPPPALKTGHLSKFQLETLFYIFYALPRDVLQAYAAQELYSREWRYHGELKRWFKRAGSSDGVANLSSGSPQYLYFDINSWERRLFKGNMNKNVTNFFLPEDEVRVKFPSS